MATPTTEDRKVEQQLKIAKEYITRAYRVSNELFLDRRTWKNSKFSNGFNELEEVVSHLDKAQREINVLV